MLFSSLPFFVFFAIYWLIEKIVPSSQRLLLIILASTVFYGYWNPYYVGIPYALVILAWASTRWMVSARTARARSFRLAVGVAALLAPLVVFKYTNFLWDGARYALMPSSRHLATQAKLLNLPLPLGISFVTFTLLAYLIDIYRNRIREEARFSMLLGSILFFPHLIAGPIVHPQQLIAQLDRPKRRHLRRVLYGLTIFTIGLAKKLVIADPLAAIVDRVYQGTGSLTGLDYLVAIYGFSVQIYCDFSGYTDMALGLAQILQVRLPNNFDRPYLAASLPDFWRRWHITLSNWLRDYLYISLGGNRSGLADQVRNIIITMALGGLWHGANWTFLVWGLMHGTMISAIHVYRKIRGRIGLPKIPRPLGIFLTFHFVTVAWIVFRARGMDQAKRVLFGAFSGWQGAASALSPNLLGILLIVGALAFHPLDRHPRFRVLTQRLKRPLVVVGLVLLWVLAMAMSAGSSSEFIYFEF